MLALDTSTSQYHATVASHTLRARRSCIQSSKLTFMCSCKDLKEKNEAEVSEDGDTKYSHDPSHYNIAEDVCTQKESHT